MNQNRRSLRQIYLTDVLEKYESMDATMWVSKCQLIKDVNDCDFMAHFEYTDNSYNRCKYSSHDLCPTMNADVIKINNDLTYDKIIVEKDNHYKIATQKEAEDYIQKLYIKAMKLLVRVNHLNQKAKRNGQGVLTERDIQYIQSFAESDSDVEN